MKSTDQDEDYLISRAKRNSQSDENGGNGNVKALSKSWLITALGSIKSASADYFQNKTPK